MEWLLYTVAADGDGRLRMSARLHDVQNAECLVLNWVHVDQQLCFKEKKIKI